MLAFSAVGKTEARVVRRRMSRPDSGFATTPTIASPKATHLLALCCAPEGKTGTAIVVRILWPGPCPLSRAAMRGSPRQGHQEHAAWFARPEMDGAAGEPAAGAEFGLW